MQVDRFEERNCTAILRTSSLETKSQAVYQRQSATPFGHTEMLPEQSIWHMLLDIVQWNLASAHQHLLFEHVIYTSHLKMLNYSSSIMT